ncbi:MAG: hypothetical protein ABIH28_03835 [archaeon]
METRKENRPCRGVAEYGCPYGSECERKSPDRISYNTDFKSLLSTHARLWEFAKELRPDGKVWATKTAIYHCFPDEKMRTFHESEKEELIIRINGGLLEGFKSLVEKVNKEVGE